MRILSLFPRLMAAAGFSLLAACGGASTTPATPATGALNPLAGRPDGIQTPALISMDLTTGALVYWPIANGPSDKPITFTKPLGFYNGYAMAGKGKTVIVANSNPPEIVKYDVKTKKQATLNDNYGEPYDVAVGKDGKIYAMQIASVTVFSGSNQTELQCPYVSTAEAIAVDNEGDVFVNGYGSSGFMGVVEYPAGSGKCEKLHLRAEMGYIGGVGVDPKTDDLIVVDDPDLCAGGYEGRMLIYPKPYRPRTSRQRILGASYCSGTFRLDATSRHIYVSDSTVSAGFPLIDVFTYPKGVSQGVYSTGYSAYTGGFTTVPNTLPN
jgi:hypothetical protein